MDQYGFQRNIKIKHKNIREKNERHLREFQRNSTLGEKILTPESGSPVSSSVEAKAKLNRQPSSIGYNIVFTYEYETHQSQKASQTLRLHDDQK